MKYFELLGLLLLCHVILCFCAYQHDGAHGASALHLFTSPDVGTKPPSSSKPPILNSRKRHSITKKKRPRTVSECLIQSFTSNHHRLGVLSMYTTHPASLSLFPPCSVFDRRDWLADCLDTHLSSSNRRRSCSNPLHGQRCHHLRLPIRPHANIRH